MIKIGIYHTKKGYNSADNQNSDTFTVAGRYKWFDILAIHSGRKGHELENYGYRNYDDNVQGLKRQKADPYKITKDSTLVKFSVSPTENHRLTFTWDSNTQKAKGKDLSYSLNGLKTSWNEQVEEKDSRHTDDLSKRKFYALTYENYTQTPFWDTLKISASQQKISNRARTDDYCDSSNPALCESIYNPMGFQLKDGKIVDKDGQDIVVKDSRTLIKDGKEVLAGFSEMRVNNEWFDCSVFDCNGSLNGFDVRWDPSYTTRTYTPKIYQFDPNKTVVTPEGKKFAQVKDATYYDYYLTPNNPGYLNRSFKDRELNTNTKQFNLDATKQIDIHNISYGALYSITDKEMVNREGYYADQVQWWANRFIGYKNSNTLHTCETAYQRTKTAVTCPNFGSPTSFLIPVRTKTGALYLTNEMKFNDYFGLNLGYRYDNIKYQPRYKHGSSPRIPESMVDQLFVPYVAPEGAPGPRPSSLADFNYDFAAYGAALAEWNKKNEAFGEIEKQAKADNVKANFDYFTKPKKYNAHSYSLEATVDPTQFFRLQYKYATGFRAPTSDEVYFTFKHPDFTILPNANLKAEKAKTQELAFTLHNDYGHISLGAFQTKYDNFIDLKFLGTQAFTNSSGVEAQAQPHQLYQNVNRDNAKVTGYELNTRLNIGAFTPKLEGLNLSYKVTYQKGRYEGNIPLNAIQPLTHIAGVGYDHPQGKFGLNIYYTHTSSKKAKDTYDMYANANEPQPLKWLSESYSVWDAVTYVQPLKNLRLQAGVYNLFNEKYTTWESARSIRPFGTRNRVASNGEGLERFLSPGRHFKLNAELTF